MAKRKPSSLTRLEGEVMRAVWGLGAGPVRVRDVLDALNAGRKQALAYNTVQTVLNILKDKGALTDAGGEGRAHFYKATLSQKDASRDMLRELADRLFGGGLSPLLQNLVDDPRLSEEELRRLRAWVDARLRDAKEDKR